MESKSRKKVHYEFEDGQRGVVDYQVGNVTRCILSAGLLSATGHTTVLAPNESYIMRERRVLHLRKERDVYLLRAKVLKKPKEGGAPIFPLPTGLEAPEPGGSSSSTGDAPAVPAAPAAAPMVVRSPIRLP